MSHLEKIGTRCFTTVLIAKIGNSFSKTGWNYNNQGESLFYIWWQCCEIEQFQKMIYYKMKQNSKDELFSVAVVFLLNFVF